MRVRASLAALALAALTACAPSVDESLKVSPLMQQAIRAYRISDEAALDALLVRLEGLKPAGVPDSEINTCTANGYLLRNIERTRLDIEHLNRRTVLSMGETARFVYFEDHMLGMARVLDGHVDSWPTDYQCEKEPGYRASRRQSDAEQQASRTYFQKMVRAWKADLIEEKGPNSFELELEAASKLLAGNRLRHYERYDRDPTLHGLPDPR
ncbi:MAG: hypothetical protein K0R83_1456 [Caulobacter sp.]|nr:hypothetical protein [Caulobacter sp.]